MLDLHDNNGNNINVDHTNEEEMNANKEETPIIIEQATSNINTQPSLPPTAAINASDEVEVTEIDTVGKDNYNNFVVDDDEEDENEEMMQQMLSVSDMKLGDVNHAPNQSQSSKVLKVSFNDDDENVKDDATAIRGNINNIYSKVDIDEEGFVADIETAEVNNTLDPNILSITSNERPGLARRASVRSTLLAPACTRRPHARIVILTLGCLLVIGVAFVALIISKGGVSARGDGEDIDAATSSIGGDIGDGTDTLFSEEENVETERTDGSENKSILNENTGKTTYIFPVNENDGGNKDIEESAPLYDNESNLVNEEKVSTSSPVPSPLSKRDKLMLALEPISGISALTDNATHAYMAFHWLSNNDTFLDDVLMEASNTAAAIVQRYIMALLYYSFDGNGWTERWNFLTPGIHECDWASPLLSDTDLDTNSTDNVLDDVEGAIVMNLNCSDDFSGGMQVITHLEFGARNRMDGTIPTELHHLSQLQSLQFSNNRIRGTIPSQLHNLSRLTRLIVSKTQITGILSPNLFGTIPIETETQANNITSPTSMLSLNNNLSEIIPTSFFPALEELVISENVDLEGPIPSTLSQHLSSTLKDLDLSKNTNLDGTIPFTFGALTKLKLLYLHDTKLTGTVPESFVNLTSLELLELHNNALTGSLEFLCDAAEYNDAGIGFGSVYIQEMTADCSLKSRVELFGW
eukprot:CAMPEP_0194382190 /NCGR_PEP_ID=MMETSP0174-20130528/58694_1 /TAXON_ID=216777 /ORGANISM="Proboscia alata, Strain PI-D3" /LENGTH=694 /DNA_ID=CAMNT_0039167289 /DNA_START=51 /DNA_END=2132 /DNA_ORIENTATION=+